MHWRLWNLSLGEWSWKNYKGRWVSTRLKKTATVYQMSRRKVFRTRRVSRKTKMCVLKVMVMSVPLYVAETWAVTQQDLRRLHAFQMKCLWDSVGMTLWHKMRNEDIFADTGEVLVEAQLKLRRLQWFGHLRRMPEYWPQWQVLKCRPQGQKRKLGGTSPSWIWVEIVPHWPSAESWSHCCLICCFGVVCCMFLFM